MPQTTPKKAITTAGLGLALLSSAVYANERYAILHDIKQLRQAKSWQKNMDALLTRLGSNVSVYRMLQLADPNVEALWFEGRTWKYSQLLTEVDKIATILHSKGVRADESVAVFMTNSPEMVLTYCALSKLGAIPALINNSLRSQTLAHCMEVADAKLIMCTPDLASSVLDLFSDTGKETTCISINLTSFPPLNLPSSPASNEKITQLRYEDLANVMECQPEKAADRKLKDTGCLIYTSGTSGKPKAVSMKNMILVMSSTPTPEDTRNPRKYYPLRIFSCLPLFHATCLLVGWYRCIGTSSTFCLARKFSASKFSQELTESGATRMLYVGELGRYLLKPPPSKYDRAHKCIVAMGNGLQGDVWNKFRERYNIPEIREFYRSTEGIAGYGINTTRSRDAGFVGREGPIARYYNEITYIVKYDSEMEAPWRDPQTGFCKLVKTNEPGEAIGRVVSMDFYRGYLNNPDADEKKFLRDVFEKGDLFQRSGDLLVRNDNGMIKFADRSGDSYRWKGENVSAGEVREHISRLQSVHDVSVFGTKLDAYDGQAGAAGITLADSSDALALDFMRALALKLRSRGLTSYQLPRLVRLTPQIDTNSTFKHVKNVLKERPWDPVSAQKVGDRVYWLDNETYKELDEKAWAEIQTGKARL